MGWELPARYQVDGSPLLGVGAMGEVIRAHDRILGRPVALKLVRSELAQDPRFRKLFTAEVRISARFAHRHLVPLHDSGLLPSGEPFLGLALADEGSLAQRRGTFVPWPQLRAWFLQLLEALGHLHSRGFLHRDLKPENVLLHRTPGGEVEVWLADLGLANSVSWLTQRKERREGTPGYMAPEQAQGRVRELMKSTDLFSVAVMLWEFATGSRPFPDDAPDAELPPFLLPPGSDVPERLGQVLAEALHPDPLGRFELAADFAVELERLEGEPQRVPPPEPLGEEFDARRTLFDPLGDLDAGSLAPPWLRPLPRPFPVAPPAPSVGSSAASASLSLFALREPPLVGRDELRTRLWQLAARARQTERPVVVLLVGESGAGKTRLVDDLATHLEEGGWAEPYRLIWNRPPAPQDGSSGAALQSLRPWNETRQGLVERLARRFGRERGGIDQGARNEAVALARWAGLLEPHEDAAPDGLGQRYLLRQVASAQWRRLSLLILEDVEGCREEGDGLSLLEALLAPDASREQRPMLALATVRSEALAENPALAARLQSLEAAGALRLEVPRLDRRATKRLLQSLLKLSPLLAGQVAQRCEGNPLFARQLLQAWADRGWLTQDDELQVVLVPGVDLDQALPGDLVELQLERVERILSNAENPRRLRDALHLGALAGQVLPPSLFQHLFATDADAAVAAGLLRGMEDGGAVWDTAMLRQALRSQADGRKDLAYLHRRLAKAWARVSEQPLRELLVGRHAKAAGEVDLALGSLLQAAAEAHARGRGAALDEASSGALELALANGHAEALVPEAAAWRAKALETVGEVRGAAACWTESLQRAQTLGQRTVALDARIGLGSALADLGRLPEGEAQLNSALETARRLADVRREARAALGLARLERQKRNLEGATLLLDRAIVRLERAGESRLLAELMLARADLARLKGDLEEAQEGIEGASERFLEKDDALGAARARLARAALAEVRSATGEAESALRQVVREAEDLGALAVSTDARLALADLWRRRGDLDRAAKAYAALRAWASRQGRLEAHIRSCLGASLTELARDRFPQAWEASEEAARSLDQAPGHVLWARYRLVVARFLAQLDDQEQCWTWLWSAVELGLSDEVDLDTAEVASGLANLAAEAGWRPISRQAAKVAITQWDRLGRSPKARALYPLLSAD